MNARHFSRARFTWLIIRNTPNLRVDLSDKDIYELICEIYKKPPIRMAIQDIFITNEFVSL